MTNLKKFFDNIEEYIIMVLLPVMVVVVFVATMARYLQLFSLPWSEELARYIMVWLAYIGASLGIKRGAHLGIDALVNALPPKLRVALIFVRTGIILLFTGLVVFYSYQIISHQQRIGQTSPALFIPIWWAYLAVPVGSLMMGIRSIQVFAGDFRNSFARKGGAE
ncbi:MAG: TRAP transporter small permease [Bacillota bacterium]